MPAGHAMSVNRPRKAFTPDPPVNGEDRFPMTKHAHSDNPSDPFSASTPLLTTPWSNGPTLDALTRAGEACSQACQAWQQEVARFTAARLQSDSELGRKLVGCGDWAEAAKLQQEWALAMAQDYMNEGNRMFQLAWKFGGEMMPSRAPVPRAVSKRGIDAAD